MARVIKSTHPIKHYSVGGVIDKALSVVAQPSKESAAAGQKFSDDLRKKRLEEQNKAETAEGARLQALPDTPAAKTKPYTNPDGTPFTREQMRKALGR